MIFSGGEDTDSFFAGATLDDHHEDRPMLDTFETESLRSFEDSFRRMTKPVPLSAPDEFERTIEGGGLVDDGAAIVAIHSALNLGRVRIIIDPEDEPWVERIVLPDGRLALDFNPQADEGITVSVAAHDEVTAQELVSAFRGASIDLAVALAEGAEIGGHSGRGCRDQLRGLSRPPTSIGAACPPRHFTKDATDAEHGLRFLSANSGGSSRCSPPPGGGSRPFGCRWPVSGGVQI